MKRLVAAAVAVAALVAAPSGAAKSCLRIEAPASVEVGETLRVVARLYFPTWRRGRVVKLVPVRSWPGRIALVATGPHGVLIRLRMLGTRDGVGVARFAFPVRGRWRLHAVGWEYAPTTCAPPRVIRVV